MAIVLASLNNIEEHFKQNHKYIPPKVGDKVCINPAYKGAKKEWAKGKSYFFVHAVIYQPYSNVCGSWLIKLMWDTSNIYTIIVDSSNGSICVEKKRPFLKVIKTYNKKYGWTNAPPEFYKMHNIKMEYAEDNFSLVFDDKLYNGLTKEKVSELINGLANINDINLKEKIKIYVDGKEIPFNIKKQLSINLGDLCLM